jgi:hypothetical protein
MTMVKYGKLIAVAISLILGAVGVFAGVDLKGMVCGGEAPAAVAPVTE